MITPRHARRAHDHARTKTRDQDLAIRARSRRVSLFSFQSTAVLECHGAALAVPSPLLRASSREASVGAQIRSERTLPRNIAVACDVSVDRAVADELDPRISGPRRRKFGARTHSRRDFEPRQPRAATFREAGHSSGHEQDRNRNAATNNCGKLTNICKTTDRRCVAIFPAPIFSTSNRPTSTRKAAK